MTKVKLVIIIQDHASICERKKSSRQQTNNDKSNDSKKSDDNKDSKGDNEQTQQPNTSSTATNTVTSNNKVVLMQTATVVVNSKQNNYSRVKCRLLFDSRSQRTYVSRILVDTIEAETIRTEYLAVGTFGASTTECLPRDVVSITVSERADQESIQIEPIVVEKICNPIQSHKLDIAESTNIRLNEFELADIYHTDVNRDIDWLRLLLEYYGGSDQNEFRTSSNS